jgi:hypothetical protein
MGSSRFTSSPTFFSQRESVPSAIDSPIWGITTSTRATASHPVSEFLDASSRRSPSRIRQIATVGKAINPIQPP